MSSLLKAIAVLNIFSPDKPELKVAEVSLKLGIPIPTLYRILSILTKARLLEKNPSNGTYVIGRALYIMGGLYLSTSDLSRAANPVIKAINDLTGEVANVSILDDRGYRVMLLRGESEHKLRHVVHIGSTSPAYAHASGKALLGALTDEEIDRLYPGEKLEQFTSKTVPNKTELKRELEQVRKNGYAFSSEQADEGVEAIASVIRNAFGNTIAAIAIAVPTVRMNKIRREKYALLIQVGAGLISYQLGYKDPAQALHQISDLYVCWQQNQPDEISGHDININAILTSQDGVYKKK